MLARLTQLDPATLMRAVPLALIAAVAIAVPTDLIDTRFFGGAVEPTTIDYVILAITATLIGLILAIRAPRSEAVDSQDRRTIIGGAISFLAVGCPVCNQVVLALVGTSGALSWWAPVQPLVGLAAIGLLLFTLDKRLATYELTACPLPAAL